MKYWSYNEYDPDSPLADPDTGGYIVTLSEDEILEKYWKYWYGKMCDKFGDSYVNNNYTIHDCIEDWIVVHWAWESDGI